MNRNTLYEIGGYSAFFWVWFILFAYWTFPYDRVAAYITDRVDKSNYGYSVEIGSLSPYWLTGIELTDVKLHKTSSIAANQDKDPKAKDDAFHIKEARVRVGVLAFLIGNTAVGFDAELEHGELDGVYEDSGDEKKITASLEQVDLGKLGILDSIISLPVKGEVGGDVDLTLGKEPSKSFGSVKLAIRGLTLGDGKAKFKVGAMGGLTIDPIEAGTVTVEFDVKGGVGTVKKLSADGKDLEIGGSGEVRFADPIARSRMDLLVRIKFTDTYKNKSDRTKALFSLLDGAPVPQVRAAKTADDALQFRLVGTLGGMRASPAGRANADGGGERPNRRARRSAQPNPADQDDETN